MDETTGADALRPGSYESDRHVLADIARAAVLRRNPADWQLTADGTWFRLIPAAHTARIQGWKLHLSATPLSAPVVLARTAPILLAAGCAFKFAHTLADVFALTDGRAPRESGGKFITVYPDDDEQLRTVADLLDRATFGLAGPAILSDRPVRPGSRVFHRYGAFQGISRLTNDGVFELMLEGPGGRPVPDRREAWFTPPPWAPSPFVSAPGTAPAGERKRPDAVLLADRFVVRAAIRHANKGGVYRALDQQTGEPVILKQARAHVGAGLAGLDARDLLRHEADMLDRLREDGAAPRRIDVFASGDSLFLAQEQIEGPPLDAWVIERLGRRADQGLDPAEARTVARGLTDLVARVHARGLVLRDLKPDNVIASPDGRLRLIDLEHVAVPGTPSQHAHTPGFAPPEQLDTTAQWEPAPDQSVDLYSLGATLFFLATGTVPFFAADDDEPRTGPDAAGPDTAGPPRRYRDRVAAFLAAASPDNAALRLLAPVITGLMQDDPADRWPLTQTADFLEHHGQPADLPADLLSDHAKIPTPRTAPVDNAMMPADHAAIESAAERAVRDGIDYLCDSADFTGRKEIWPSGNFGSSTDRCSPQHGASGVLLVLARAAELGDDRARAALDQGARWLARRVNTLPRLLPGLLFGSSGTAAALHEAARVLDDADLADQALDLALRIPLDWANPDVCHGLAGAGLAHLQLWQRTHDPRLTPRIRQIADALTAAADFGPFGVFWPVPKDFDSRLAGLANYGFGHGVAGVAAFLLAAGQETGEDSYLRLARAAGETLAAAADVDLGPAAPHDPEHGLVLWPTERGGSVSNPNPMRLHWCNGASGIGTFLVRLWRATGEDQYGLLARQAARTVQVNRWQHSPALCHGLAGSGELLLDLHEAFPDHGFHHGAHQVAQALLTRDVIRGGRHLLVDETALNVVADYGTGLAGALGFLLRLRSGQPRLLMPQDTSLVGATAVTR